MDKIVFMDHDTLKHVAKEWHEAFGTDKLKVLYEKYLHDQFTADFFEGQQVNRAQYAEQDQQFASAFSNNTIRVTEQIAEDNKVVSVMTWSATHTGDIPGLKATGKSFEISGVAIDYFRDGKVVRHFPYSINLK